MITFRQKGDFSKASRYLERLKEAAKLGVLDKYGREGVAALASATPTETGLTASSWTYEIERKGSSISIRLFNQFLIELLMKLGRRLLRYEYDC